MIFMSSNIYRFRDHDTDLELLTMMNAPSVQYDAGKEIFKQVLEDI